MVGLVGSLDGWVYEVLYVRADEINVFISSGDTMFSSSLSISQASYQYATSCSSINTVLRSSTLPLARNQHVYIGQHVLDAYEVHTAMFNDLEAFHVIPSGLNLF